MYKIFIALIMAVVCATVTPKQGSPLPNNTITITAYKLHGDCGYIVAQPYVDRPGIYYTQTVIDYCHYVDSFKMVTSTIELYFTGVDGYITHIEFKEVYPGGGSIPGTSTKKIPGWWWTGDILPAGVYPPPIQ